jgi:hypothetical protein
MFFIGMLIMACDDLRVGRVGRDLSDWKKDYINSGFEGAFFIIL